MSVCVDLTCTVRSTPHIATGNVHLSRFGNRLLNYPIGQSQTSRIKFLKSFFRVSDPRPQPQGRPPPTDGQERRRKDLPGHFKPQV